jgi:capsular polysaccharide transport system permease protein
MYEAVAEDVDLQQVFARRGADWYFSMDQGLPIEERVDYWNSMVHVDFDSSSGIITVEAKAFEPDDAQRIAQSVLDHSAELVNELSATARREIVASAEDEVAAAEDRLRDARAAMRAYRDRTQEIDPVENARMAAELIGSLEQELARLQSELNTALAQMGPESPRVRVMEQQISSLELQIAMERMRLGSGGEEATEASETPDVADRIQDYEALQTEAEFAQQAYLSAMASLESARQDADRKQRYLATFLYPDQAQQSEYPRRLLLIVLATLGFGFVWGVGVMLYYNLKDRA